MSQRKTVQDIIEKKKKGEKIVMLTAYDSPMAVVLDRAGVDIALVGDSVANVVLGLERTKLVGMDEMIHHTKAVNRGLQRALLVGDMPFEAYQEDGDKPVVSARRFVDEAGAQAVKLEWFDQCPDVAKKIIDAGIPVMGHVGLTPQTAEAFKVQGKDAASAAVILENAKTLENVGCFSVVLECIPDTLAKIVTESLSIPTIGIGAGVYCDGQVLVTHDLLGFFDKFQEKFAKQYTNISQISLEAIQQFCQEVKSGKFPDDAHSYHINEEELRTLR